MQETTLKQRSSLARHVSRNCCYVSDPIYAGETRNFWQLIRSLYPTNLLLSFRSTLSLQRHFLTATLSFIDRGCHLEKQKNRGGGRTGKGGRGRQEKKTNRSPAKQTMTRAWKGAFPGIDTKKSSDARVNIMSETRRSHSCRICKYSFNVKTSAVNN